MMNNVLIVLVFVIGFGLGHFVGYTTQILEVHDVQLQHNVVSQSATDVPETALAKQSKSLAAPIVVGRESSVAPSVKEESSESSLDSTDAFWNQVGLGEENAETAIQNLVGLYADREFGQIEDIEAIVASPEFYDPAFVNALLNAYVQAEDDVLQQAFKDLVHLSQNDEVITEIGEHMMSYDELKQSAALNLIKGSDLSQQPEIRHALHELVERTQDPTLMASAIDNLAFVVDAPEENARTRQTLERALHSQDESVQMASISKLVALDRERTAIAPIRKVLRYGSENLQIVTLDAIAAHRYVSEGVKAELVSLVIEGQTSAVRDGAKDILSNYFALTETELAAVDP